MRSHTKLGLPSNWNEVAYQPQVAKRHTGYQWHAFQSDPITIFPLSLYTITKTSSCSSINTALFVNNEYLLINIFGDNKL